MVAKLFIDLLSTLNLTKQPHRILLYGKRGYEKLLLLLFIIDQIAKNSKAIFHFFHPDFINKDKIINLLATYNFKSLQLLLKQKKIHWHTLDTINNSKSHIKSRKQSGSCRKRFQTVPYSSNDFFIIIYPESFSLTKNILTEDSWDSIPLLKMDNINLLIISSEENPITNENKFDTILKCIEKNFEWGNNQYLLIEKCDDFYFQGLKFYFTISNNAINLFPALNKELYSYPPNELSNEKVSSGIKELDESLNGGLYKNSILYLLGNSGTGKTVFCFNFLINSSKDNEKGIYFTFSPKKIRLQKEIEWKTNELTNKKILTVEQLNPLSLSIEEFLWKIYKSLKKTKASRIVIDDIHRFPLYRDKRLILFLHFIARAFETTMIITGIPSATEISFVSEKSIPNFAHDSISEIADYILQLKFSEEDGTIHKQLMIIKSASEGTTYDVGEFLVGEQEVSFIKPSHYVPMETPTVSPSKGIQKKNVYRVVIEVFYFDKDEETIVKRRVEEINRKFTDIRFELPDRDFKDALEYNQKLEDLLKGNVDLDLFSIDAYRLQSFVENDLIIPLDDYVTEEFKDNYIEIALKQGVFKNRLYGLPHLTNVGVLVYRRDLLDKYGFSPPETWDELLKISRYILDNENDPNLYGFGFQGAQFENLSCNFLEFLWNNGGDVFDESGKIIINNNRGIEALTFMTDLINKHKISPPNTPNFAEFQTERLFVNGQLIFLRTWPRIMSQAQWQFSKVKNVVGLTRLPIGPSGENPTAVIGAFCYVISKKVKNPKVLLDFYNQFYSPDGIVELAIKGWSCPVFKSVYQNSDVLRTRPYYREMPKLLEAGRSRQDILLYEFVTQQIRREINLALRGMKNPKQALDTIAENIHRTIHIEMHKQPIQKALDFIDSNINEEIDRDTVARVVNLSPSYFSALFKEVTGYNFTEYITFKRIEKAKKLLDSFDYNIAEISRLTGFQDESYFCYVFKKITHMTPSLYRINVQKTTLPL